MLPTLEPGAIVLVDPRRSPQVGDVVVARHPFERDTVLVKRVEGMTPHALDLRGDAPEESTDSRSYGALPRDRLLGVVTAAHSTV